MEIVVEGLYKKDWNDEAQRQCWHSKPGYTGFESEQKQTRRLGTTQPHKLGQKFYIHFRSNGDNLQSIKTKVKVMKRANRFKMFHNKCVKKYEAMTSCNRSHLAHTLLIFSKLVLPHGCFALRPSNAT